MFKRKPRYKVTVCGGAMNADFYVSEKNPQDNFLHIHTPNGVFEQKVVGYTAAYLLGCVKQNQTLEVEAFCTLMWRLTQEIYQDTEFAADIVKAVTARDGRLMMQAQINAQNTTDEQIAADEALMQEVAEYADASNKERKKIREQWRQDTLDALNAMNEDEEEEQ